MKRFPALVALVSAALALAPALSLAESGSGLRRQPQVVSRPGRAGNVQIGRKVADASADGYSVQLNIVTRVVGASFYRTAVDITNNTGTDGVVATFQYCYTTQNGVYQGCTDPQDLLLHEYDSEHFDDIIEYVGSLGLISPDAANFSFGTFFVTFAGLPSNVGWEGTLTGRTYNAADNADPEAGTVAIAYPGSLFFESATGTLVAIVRDTTLNPTEAGALRTNLGVTNTALYSFDSVDFEISFYDVVTGALVGNVLSPNHALEPGEVYQFNNVFSAAHIPADVESCIAFIDITSPQGADPLTIEAYVNILDAGTNDGAYFEFKCSVGCL
jgi:hypothetical protein